MIAKLAAMQVDWIIGLLSYRVHDGAASVRDRYACIGAGCSVREVSMRSAACLAAQHAKMYFGHYDLASF